VTRELMEGSQMRGLRLRTFHSWRR
jgi:hypothetical protein